MLKNTPPTTRVKKANLRISNEKEDDGDQTVEATTDNTEIHSSNGGSREKPSEEKEKCEEYEEDEEEKEETDKKPKQKGGKKKPAAATPKASPDRIHLILTNTYILPCIVLRTYGEIM